MCSAFVLFILIIISCLLAIKSKPGYSCVLWKFKVSAVCNVTGYKKKSPASSDEGRDDAEYEEIPVKAATTGAVGAATNITLTQNTAYSLPCELT